MNTKIRYDLDSLELANGDFGYPITFRKLKKIKFLSRYNVYFGQYLL